MRDFNEFLLAKEAVTPGSSLTSNQLVSTVLGVENARAHTLAVKLLRHPAEETGDTFMTIGAGQFTLSNGSTQVSLAGRGGTSGLAIGMEVEEVLNGRLSGTIASLSAMELYSSDAASADSEPTDILTVTLPTWTPSVEEAIIIVYAVLPALTSAEASPLDTSTERLIELERTTMSLADLASKGWGRSEGLCAYNSVKVKIECSSTE